MKTALTATIAATLMATSATACPWSGGEYFGKYLGFRIDIVVDKGCAQATITSQGSAGFQEPDKPETFPLAKAGDGWVADVNGSKVLLDSAGKYIWIDGPAMRKRFLAHQN